MGRFQTACIDNEGRRDIFQILSVVEMNIIKCLRSDDSLPVISTFLSLGNKSTEVSELSNVRWWAENCEMSSVQFSLETS